MRPLRLARAPGRRVAPPAGAPPALAAAVVQSSDHDSLVLTFDQSLLTGNPTGAGGLSLLSSGGSLTVTSVAVVGATVTCGLSRNVVYGEVLTLAYSQGGSSAPFANANGFVANFSGASVANQVPGEGGGGDGYSVLDQLGFYYPGNTAFNAPPVAPAIGGPDLTATTAGEIQSAINGGNGRRIVVAPGSYSGNWSFSGARTNIELVLDDVTLNAGTPGGVMSFGGCSRVVVRGNGNSRVRGGGLATTSPTDLRIFGIDVESTSAHCLDGVGGLRVWFENGRLYCNANAAAFYQQAAGRSIVIANSEVQGVFGTQAAMRMHGSNVAVIDSFVRNPTHHTLRGHADDNNTTPSPVLLWAGLTIQGGHVQLYGGPGNPLQCNYLRFVANKYHANATGFFMSPADIAAAYIHDNAVRSALGSLGTNGGSFDVGGNTYGSYIEALLADWNSTGLPQEADFEHYA